MSDTTLHSSGADMRRSTLSAVIVGTIVSLGLMVMFTLLGLAIGVASLEAAGQRDWSGITKHKRYLATVAPCSRRALMGMPSACGGQGMRRVRDTG